MASGVAASSPASTGRVTPETQRASSEARNRAAQATSHGRPLGAQGTSPAAQAQHLLGAVADHHWTANVTRGDAIDSNIIPSVVHRHGIAQSDNAPLGCGVGVAGTPAAGSQAHNGGEG